VTGLAALRGKESDRIACLARGLAALGLSVGHGADFLRIAPRDTPGGAGADAGPRVLDPAGDHRMAFAFALCSLVRPAVYVADPGCVSKSWPSFWRDLAKCGARVATHAEGS
jgi:3-phosphoshikimate 1-carboxyvinyltransferase